MPVVLSGNSPCTSLWRSSQDILSLILLGYCSAGDLALIIATCGSLVVQAPTSMTLFRSLSLSPIRSCMLILKPLNRKKKSSRPRFSLILFLSSQNFVFIDTFSLPSIMRPGVSGSSKVKVTSISCSGWVTASLASGLTWIASFWFLQKSLPVDVEACDGLVGAGVGAGV